jgi:hypothetical protein
MIGKTITTSSPGLLEASLLPGLKGLLYIDFADHDTILTAYLSAALKKISSWADKTIPVSTAKVVILNPPASYQIPVVPFRAVTAGKKAGVTLTSNELLAYKDGLVLDLPADTSLELTILTGYDELPDDLSTAIKMLAATLFDGKPRDWKAIAADYKGATWAS